MNRTRLVFIGVLALALGAFASVLSYRALQHGGPMPVLQDVVVAATDIPVGHKLDQADVRIVHLPADSIPPGSFRHAASVMGRGVLLPMAQGEFFIAGKNLASENAGSGLPSLITSGMRAVSVRVSDSSSVAGFATPGTRVDVLMTGNAGSGNAQTITVLKNIRVLATGTKLSSGYGTDTQISPIITLLVSPADAEKLALAQAQGRIELTLRNPLDTGQSDVGGIRVSSLFPDEKPATPVSPRHIRPRRTPAAQAPPAPSWYPVEVIKGDKRDVTKLTD